MRLSSRFITSVFFLIVVASSVYAQQWEMTGLLGRSGVCCVDGDTLYFGTDGGHFRSLDHGATWQLIHPSPYEPRRLAAHGSTLFSIDATQHLTRSLDGGATWAAVNGFGNATGVFYSPRGFLLGVYGGIYRSTDDGNTWAALTTEYKQASPVAFAVHGDTIAVADNGGSSSGGLIVSIDDGATWSHNRRTSFSSGVYSQDVFIAPDGSIYLASDYGLERSSDAGTTWQKRDTGIYNIGGWPSARCVLFLGDTMYAGSGHQAIYRSLDRGHSWQLFNDGLYDWQITRKLERSGNDIIASTTDGMFILHSGTSKWESLNGTIPAARTIGNLMTAFGRLYAPTIGMYGPCYSVDQGKNWVRDYASYYTYGYLPDGCYDLVVNDSGMWAASSGSSLYRSRDSGRSWFATTGRGARFFPNGNRLYTTFNQSMYRTATFGKTWDTLRVPIQSISAYLRYVLEADGGIFAGADDGLYRSTDDGITWKKDSTAIKKRTVLSLAVEDGYLFAGSDTGVYRSSDAGVHWQRMNAGLPDSLIQSFLVNDTLLLAGTSDGVFRSSDLGVSWARFGAGLEGKLIGSLKLYNGFLFASTVDYRLGSNVYRLQLDPNAAVAPAPKMVESRVFPNPALDRLRIVANIQSESELTIFTLDGTEVFQEVLPASAGGVGAELNVRSWSSGCYYYTIRSAHGGAYGKFTIAK